VSVFKDRVKAFESEDYTLLNEVSKLYLYDIKYICLRFIESRQKDNKLLLFYTGK
jgi:hypothetical protein